MRMGPIRILAIMLAGIGAAACDSADEAAAPQARSEVSADDPADVDAAAGGVTPAVDPAAEAIAATASDTAATGGLAAYVGKYPFDKVDGLTFYEQPAVKTAIAAAIPDATVRGWVMGDRGGPSAPIEMKNGKIASWACEQHNCGDHQWTVLVDTGGKAAEVCYQDAAAIPGKTRWYSAGAAPETRDGTCQL